MSTARPMLLLAAALVIATASGQKKVLSGLFYAIEQHNEAGIKAIIDDGEDPEEKGPQGMTPLLYASAWGTGKIVSDLLEMGADTKAVDDGGNTACLSAGRAGNPETMALLLSKGFPCTTEFHKSSGLLPFHYAVQGKAPYYTETVKVLLKAGADPQTKTKDFAQDGAKTALELCQNEESHALLTGKTPLAPPKKKKKKKKTEKKEL